MRPGKRRLITREASRRLSPVARCAAKKSGLCTRTLYKGWATAKVQRAK
jgi:hypothetical protein